MIKTQMAKIYSKWDDLPEYKTHFSAGADLRAFIEGMPEAAGNKVRLQPMQRLLIPTGIWIEIPEGYEGDVRMRSGLSIKEGMGVVNGVGTIDSDYRGEIKVIAINLSDQPITIKHGDRIAQLVVLPYLRLDFDRVNNLWDLDLTERGTGGFGSTGKE